MFRLILGAAEVRLLQLNFNVRPPTAQPLTAERMGTTMQVTSAPAIHA